MRRTEEGTLYFIPGVKWYRDCGNDIEVFYADLEKNRVFDYLVIGACEEYPGNTEADAGAWEDNPWDLEKQMCEHIYVDGDLIL